MPRYDIWVLPTLAHPPSAIGLMELHFLEKMGIEILHHLPIKRVMMMALEKLASEALEKTPNTQIFNLAGAPAISIPAYVAKNGLPIGVQMGAAMGREDLLLNVARQLEDHYQWFNRLPVM